LQFVIAQTLYRRSNNARASIIADPIHMNISFVQALGDYVKARQEDINIIVARFFYLFVKECPLMESYEVDNFILRNAGVLSSW
jgi:hypothetical protein